MSRHFRTVLDRTILYAEREWNSEILGKRGRINTPMNEDVRTLIDELVQKIVENYAPEKIVLYGSYAHGTPRGDSDVDLFIVKETSANRSERWVELKRLLWDKNRDIPVSPIVYTPMELRERLALGDFFVKEIMDTGRVLYERGSQRVD